MRIHLAFALIACAAHAKPADDALAALLLNSKFAVNPSATRSTLQKPLVASRQVVMKELDSEAVNKDLLSLATMAATLMPAAAHAEIVPSLQAFFNSILFGSIVVGGIFAALSFVAVSDQTDRA
eukprot:CAMPEP_0169106046 /NCGR_PEP_ID=MMETSP1015-20121227/24122_1 /TAXON_ID=342587 /ORGANISM="Karlodinium micrum, Strain CCMP2283" /LENGTH=123 /DNA_ID=CAMNT_0009167449 /DNA_START=42 /DNA_END=413 /DNA_ORIENTATION=-